MTITFARSLVTLLFLLSGVAALIYQVTWQRLLVVFAGGDVHSVTIIVGAFMIGLGFGNLAGGVLADRLSPGRNLLLFGVAEALVALFAFASKYLYYDVLYQRFGELAASRGLTALVLVASLLVPTFLMGLSLPLLARGMVRGLAEAPGRVGVLYGVNTLGAALGAALATWMLIPQFGLEGSIRWAAVINLICAVAVVALALAPAAEAAPAPEDSRATMIKTGKDRQSGPDKPEVRWNFSRWLVIYALAGFVALALEIVWFRLLGVMLKSTAFTFGTLLAVYLGGIGLGTLAGTRLVARSRRPAAVFLFLQSGIGVYAGIMTALILAAMNDWEALREFRLFLEGNEPLDVNAAIGELKASSPPSAPVPAAAPSQGKLFLGLYLVLPLVMVGPPTLLMGLSFPFLQKAVQTDLPMVGRRVGWLQSANIAGCMLGTAAVSLFALPALGTALTLKLLVGLGAVFALLALASLRSSHVLGKGYAPEIAAVCVTGFCLLAVPSQAGLWARAHGTQPGRVIMAEDGTGVSLLKKSASTNFSVNVFVNGLGQSWLPYDGIHTALGALPALIHPAPEDVAIIGLGSGDTLYAAAARKETRRVVCYEIIGAQLDTLRQLGREWPYPGLHDLLADPRISQVTGDGRLHLMNTAQRFDIIEADALRPSSAHSGSLYSVEYFQLLARRLKPGGFAVTWCPTQRVHDTFVKVFPHVLTFGVIAIGSNEPFQTDPQTFERRLKHPDVRAYYEQAGIDLHQLLLPYVGPGAKNMIIGPQHGRAHLTNINTDVFPKDEFDLFALWK